MSSWFQPKPETYCTLKDVNNDLKYFLFVGESLEKAGYAVWDNYYEDGKGERCGAMLYNGRLNDVSCEDLKCFFVCETNRYQRVNVTAGHRQ